MTMFIFLLLYSPLLLVSPPHPSFHLPSDGFHMIIGLQAQLPRRLNGKQRPTLPLSYSAVSVLFSSSKAIFITQHISLISSAELFIPTNHINGGIHLCWTGLGRKVHIYVNYGGSRSLKWRWTFLRGRWDGAKKRLETTASLGFARCLYPKGSMQNKCSDSVAVCECQERECWEKGEETVKKKKAKKKRKHWCQHDSEVWWIVERSLLQYSLSAKFVSECVWEKAKY